MLQELDEIFKFRYLLSEKDMYKTKFPYRKVLQLAWGNEGDKLGVSAVFDIFKRYIQDNLLDLRKLDIIELNSRIYAKVSELKSEYPECFDEVGFYTKKILAEYYLQGRLRVDGVIVCPEDIEKREEAFKSKIENWVKTRKHREEELKDIALTEYQEALARYYDDYRPIYIGYVFKRKTDLLLAYKDVAGKGSQGERLDIIRTYIDVEYTGKGWLVQGILREDKICRIPPDYPEPRFNKRG